MKQLITLFTILFFMANNALNAQNIIYVTPAGSGDGSSWTNATNDLQAAIDNAVLQTPKATVWVAAGTYYGNTSDSTNAFLMADGVNVYGGFAGNEPASYDLSLRDFATNATILDGQNVRRVLCQSTQFTDSTTWDGITIQHGRCLDLGSGALLISKVCLNHCIIEKNYTLRLNFRSKGGAVNVRNSTLLNCIIRNNTDDRTFAAGVYGNHATLINCIICNNYSDFATTIQLDTCSVTGCTITNNYGWLNGGISSMSSIITNCVIWNNGPTIINQSTNSHSDYSYCAVQGGVGGSHNICLKGENNGTSLLCPRFVNPSPIIGIDTVTPNIDWSLQPNSICVNHGDNSVAFYNTDFAGNARIQQGTVDIGCYESAYEVVNFPNYPDGIVYVTEEGAGTQDGTSWNNAMGDMYSAILTASTMGSIPIWAAAGTYYSTGGDEYSAFFLLDGTKIFGGFAGNEPADYDLSLRDFVAHETILDGQQERRVLCQNSSYILDTMICDGLTIQNGNAMADRTGGGIRSVGISIIRNCKIAHNCAYSSGGGIYFYCESILDQCEVFDNWLDSSYTYGGFGSGISATNSLITNCSFHDNFNRNHNACGGGLTVYDGTVNNCEIFNNYNNDSGGGIYSENSTFNNCHIYNNTSAKDGGGATLVDCILNNCNIHNNTTGRNGGGIELYSGRIYNCNFYNNSTTTDSISKGSAIYLSKNRYSTANSQLINCNVVNNSAAGTTAAIFIDNDNSALTNCIVWGNRDNANSPQIDPDTSEISVTYCAIEGGYEGEGNINLAPENSGDDSDLYYVNFLLPTSEAGAENEDECNWVLTSASVCIDAGTPDTTGLNLPATDNLGNNRIENNRIDIGANEYFLGTFIAETTKDIDNHLTLFPNPANQYVELHIMGNDSQIKGIVVYDMVGKICSNHVAQNFYDGQSAQINVSDLTTGTYFVQVIASDGSIFTKKFVKY